MVSAKIYSIYRKSTVFGHFWLPRFTFRVDFLNVQEKNRKIHGHFPEGGCWTHVVSFELSFFKKVRRGASRFASRYILKSVNLAGCNIMGQPFVAC